MPKRIRDYRYWASRSFVTVTMVRKLDGSQPGFFINKNGFAPQIRRMKAEIWDDINRNNRVITALSTVFYDYMHQMMINLDAQEISIEFHVGYIYFAEHCLYYDDEGNNFELEMPEVIALLANSFDNLKKWSRRLGKTTTDKIADLRDTVCFSNFKVGVIERNWPMCKDWLEDEGPRQYLERSTFLIQWANGLRTKLKTKLFFGNGSAIITSPVKGINQHMVGKGLRRVREDEKSKHPPIVDALGERKASGITTVLQGQKRRKGLPPIIRGTSSTPDGVGTDFFKDEQNTKLLRLLAPVGCPMGYKRDVCNQRIDGELCQYFTLTRYLNGKSDDKTLCCMAPIKWLEPDEHGISYPDFTDWYFRLPDDRTREGNVVEAMKNEIWELGKELWLQEYMCYNLDFTGNAFDREMLAKFMDDSVERDYEGVLGEIGYIHSSKKPCVAALDLGRTKFHQTVLIIAEEYEPGEWRIIRIVYLQDWLRKNFGIKIPHAHYLGSEDEPGIFHYVLEILKGEYGNYNIISMVGDATGPGGSYIEDSFKRMFMEKFGFDGVIPFKIESKSEKFGGGKMGIARSLMANINSGKIKSIYNEKLRLEALAWKIEETKRGTLIGHAPERGKVRSDDGLITAMLINWLAFSKVITENFIPDIEMQESTFAPPRKKEAQVAGDDNVFVRMDERPTRWYEDV